MQFLNHRSAPVTRLAGSIFLSALVLSVIAGCDVQGDAGAAMPPPPEVDVATVLLEPVTITETFTGRLEAPETVELRPRVSGYIDSVTFTEGELVAEGDVLFSIDARPYEARVRAARAELDGARNQLALAGQEAERARDLMEDRAISREEHDQRQSALADARARVGLAEATLETAELDLEYTQVVAPVSGRAGRAQVTRGNLANANQSVLTTIVSVNPLHVYFNSNESDAHGSRQLVDPRAETPVRVTLGRQGETSRMARLDYIDNRLDPATGTLTFRAELPNPDGRFTPGQFARVEMPVTRLEQALLVDRKAVLTDQDRRYVYVVGDDNTAVRRDIRTGAEAGGLLVIDDGLAPGDRVIVNGTQRIFFPGMPVNPKTVAMRPGEDDGNAGVALNQR